NSRANNDRLFTSGKYEVSIRSQNPASNTIRIIAEGYSTADSPAFAVADGRDRSYDFKLSKDKTQKNRGTIEGLVRKPDGTPAAGVHVDLGKRGDPIDIRNGVVQRGPRRLHVQTDQEGKFQFPPQNEDETLIVVIVDDAGFYMAPAAAI